MQRPIRDARPTRAASRRAMLLAGASLALVAGSRCALSQNAEIADPFTPVKSPPQPPMREGRVALSNGAVFVRDSGGDGPAIVLMHPATGSGLIWEYQTPAFVAAGYRVIAWSRRGHFGSDPVDKANPGSYTRDLDELATSLGLTRFNLVASAAGCTIALDYAMSFPARLRRLVLCAGSLGNIAEADMRAASEASRLAGFDDLPADVS